MDKLQHTVNRIRPLDQEAMRQAQARQDNLTKPQGSLGLLEELSVKVAGIQGVAQPKIRDKVIVTMAGDHGVAAEGVSLFPQEVTAQMVYNFLRGGAGINVLARHVGARVVVVDMGVATDLEPHPELLAKKVAYGTKNMAQGPAMSREEAIQAIEAGIEIVESELIRGMDIVGTGDMGIGNTTPSSAIVAALTGAPVADVTGRGTGIDDEQLAHKVETIDRALAVNRPDPADPLDVLAKVGGLEIGGIAGVVLGAAAHRLPVVLDGFISGAGALIAAGLAPQVKDYLIAAHLSVELGHRLVLEQLGLSPLLNLNLRLGEGTGAALGISLVEAAVKVLNEMATFADAGVSEAVE
ncbi:MAG: nicotinate-nucleotide--dimethylbenzimidazole phosphoribosyltransferase [Anaerolineae bacterium]|nr:nicotinate-nucleotide--dimethylbenzimidazole phosphoribosyltransferase [Anaerolineae bacterium]